MADRFLRKRRHGKNATELPWCQHETISFHLGLNSRDMETRWGRGEGGSDLEACESAGFPGPAFFFFFFSTASFSLSLSLSPFVGNKHISKDELFPPHWRTCFTFRKTEGPQWCGVCKQGWCVCVCLTCVFLLLRFR